MVPDDLHRSHERAHRYGRNEEVVRVARGGGRVGRVVDHPADLLQPAGVLQLGRCAVPVTADAPRSFQTSQRASDRFQKVWKLVWWVLSIIVK